MTLTEQFTALASLLQRAIDSLPHHASPVAVQVRLKGAKALCERGIALTRSHYHDPVR